MSVMTMDAERCSVEIPLLTRKHYCLRSTIITGIPMKVCVNRFFLFGAVDLKLTPYKLKIRPLSFFLNGLKIIFAFK